MIEAHGDHDDLEDRIDAFTRGDGTIYLDSAYIYIQYIHYYVCMYVGNVLVATTVIENGVDMPNVNTIVVLQANRFGISTLYQLRGRVGRYVCMYACMHDLLLP